MTNRKHIILFDGVCNLCNSTVQFILKRDKRNQFLFASLQGEAGQRILQTFNLPDTPYNTIVLVEGEKIFTKSTGALRILHHLSGGWGLLYGFIIVPKFLRDQLYNLVSKNRYKLFGKQERCLIPTPEFKERFLD